MNENLKAILAQAISNSLWSVIKPMLIDVMKVEGWDKVTNDPNDNGGKTKFGVTQKVASEYGVDDVALLEADGALAIYYAGYVMKYKYDLVLRIAPFTAVECIDTQINGGTPSLWLQEWLNGFNTQNKYGADLKTDGSIGQATIGLLTAYMRDRGVEGDKVLACMLNADQGVRYKGIAKTNTTQRKFLYGWCLNRVLNQVKNL